MTTIGDDCYFFCTSTCSKGSSCPFRHVEAAKTCRIICQHWQMGGCFRPSCKFRHSDFPIQIIPTDVPCYWETHPSGCKKFNCTFKHTKPRPTEEGGDSKDNKSVPSPPIKSESVSTENGSSGSPLNFVRPVVEPVVIGPDSEASNSSPVKMVDKRKLEEQKEVTSQEKADSGKSLPKKLKLGDHNDGAKKKGKPVGKKVAPKVNVKKKSEKIVPKKKKAEAKNEKSQPKKAKIVAKPIITKKTTSSKKKDLPMKASVKERLGTVRRDPAPKPKKEESESDVTDSDDSIENVKVLSMEEIFRQKALESMMKKRAAEGKPMLPGSVSAVKKPAQPLPKVVKSTSKKVAPLTIKRKPVKEEVIEEEEDESDDEEEEDEEESEEESEEEEETLKDEEDETEEEEEDSSSESESSDSTESEEEIEAPRRVIIDMDDKKPLKRKKENFIQRTLKSDLKPKKREVFREASLHSEPRAKKSKVTMLSHSSDLRNRLGKSVSRLNDNSNQKVPKTATKRTLIVEDDRLVDNSEKLVNEKSRGDIKIKTLEEIRAEKMRKLQDIKFSDINSLSPQKEQQVSEIQPVKRTIMLRDEDNASSLSDPGTDVTGSKKMRKRPWKRNKTSVSPQGGEDQRTISTTGPQILNDDFQRELEEYKTQHRQKVPSPESPTESLRRRALLKKSQSLGLVGESHEASEKSSSKKSKHKHKHKKKSKTERQIYVPPALKSSGTVRPGSLVDESEVPLDPIKNLTQAEPIDVPKPAAPQRVAAQRVGALWAAGLSISSKGLGVRNVPKKEIVKETKSFQPKPITISTKKVPVPSEDNLPIKTFSQIMAEKRQKRLQQQAIKTNPSSGNPSVSAQSDSKPRVPIVPILFNSGDGVKQMTTPAVTSVKSSLGAHGTARFQESSSISKGDLLYSNKEKESISARPEKSKKLFKKKVSKEDTADSDFELDLDSSTHMCNKEFASHSLPVTLKKETAVSNTSIPFSSSTNEKISSTERAEQKRLSLEDDFSFFEDDDFEVGVVPEDVEPIDDLLQDIDDLLA